MGLDIGYFQPTDQTDCEEENTKLASDGEKEHYLIFSLGINIETGEATSIVGDAYAPDPNEPAKMNVRFFLCKSMLPLQDTGLNINYFLSTNQTGCDEGQAKSSWDRILQTRSP
ncbi:uncharacterized protein [Ptychodera flava]|uniref:uncharacterized protein n=1 Tax=Ptychodera flava TaxID=63121 RepID=UPI003969F22B